MNRVISTCRMRPVLDQTFHFSTTSSDLIGRFLKACDEQSNTKSPALGWSLPSKIGNCRPAFVSVRRTKFGFLPHERLSEGKSIRHSIKSSTCFMFTLENNYSSSGYAAPQQARRAHLNPSALIVLTASSDCHFRSRVKFEVKKSAPI